MTGSQRSMQNPFPVHGAFTTIRLAHRLPFRYEKDAEDWNNDATVFGESNETDRCPSRSSIKETTFETRPRSVEVNVEIWAPSSFIRTRIGSSPRHGSWLRIANGDHSPRKPSRPISAPPTVQKVQLKRRPLTPSVPTVQYPTPPKPLKKPKPIFVSKRSVPQLKSTSNVSAPRLQIPVTTPPRPEPKPVQNAKAIVGEASRRESMKRKRSLAKSKAEKAFQELMRNNENESSVHCVPYIEPSPIPG